MQLRNPIPLALEDLVPLPDLFLHDSYLHGQLHVARVMVHGFVLLEATQALQEASRLWAAIYLHDLARTHDGACRRHGADAVERLALLPEVQALLRRGGLQPKDDEIVATAVTQHSIPQELPQEHPHRPLTALLKDADGLDRVRLGDLDTQYLRHPASRRLVSFAQALYVATAFTHEPGPDLFGKVWSTAQALWSRHSPRM